MNILTNNYIKNCFKQREATSNKSDHGHALIIAGRPGLMGSAVIAAKACLRSGSGLLTVCVPREERTILQISIPEAMLMMREDKLVEFDRFSAIGIGPGIGIDPISKDLLISVMADSNIPLVLDADALTILSKEKELFSRIPAKTIITPHTGEFDRLFGVHRTDEERIITARVKAAEYKITIVLKGPHSAIITAEEVWVNTTGNAGLAKGGSGDALTGVITSLIAQGYSPVIAAKMAVYFHGLAADITLNEQSLESMLITDVIDHFGKAFQYLKGE